MLTETFIVTRNNIEDEIKISNIIKLIPNYNLYFQPILQHSITHLTTRDGEIFDFSTHAKKKKSLISFFSPLTNIAHQSSNDKTIYEIEKEIRNLTTSLPLLYKDDILDYLFNATINVLLDNNIYVPLNNKTIQYDITNKIPIIVDFKDAYIITKWQNKNDFLAKYKAHIIQLNFNT